MKFTIQPSLRGICCLLHQILICQYPAYLKTQKHPYQPVAFSDGVFLCFVRQKRCSAFSLPIGRFLFFDPSRSLYHIYETFPRCFCKNAFHFYGRSGVTLTPKRRPRSTGRTARTRPGTGIRSGSKRKIPGQILRFFKCFSVDFRDAILYNKGELEAIECRKNFW